MSGNYRDRRLFTHITVVNVSVKLPWPMTRGEMVVFFEILLAIGLVGFVVGGWVGTLLFEPSLLRLLPIILFFLLVRFVIARPLLHTLTPRDIAERWSAFYEQEIDLTRMITGLPAPTQSAAADEEPQS